MRERKRARIIVIMCSDKSNEIGCEREREKVLRGKLKIGKKSLERGDVKKERMRESNRGSENK